MATIFEIKVRDMPLSEDVKTCSENTTLAKAVELMQQTTTGTIVIVKDLRPIGIFTERDFLMKLGNRSVDLNTSIIGNFMTPNPVCMLMDDLLYKVMLRMRIGRFRNIVITEPSGTLKKVLSLRDVMYFLSDWLQAKAPGQNRS